MAPGLVKTNGASGIIGLFAPLHEDSEFPDLSQPLAVDITGTHYVDFKLVEDAFVVAGGDEPASYETIPIKNGSPNISSESPKKGNLLQHKIVPHSLFQRLRDVLDCSKNQCDSGAIYKVQLSDGRSIQLKIDSGQPTGLERKTEGLALDDAGVQKLTHDFISGLSIFRETIHNPTERTFDLKIESQVTGRYRQGIVRQTNRLRLNANDCPNSQELFQFENNTSLKLKSTRPVSSMRLAPGESVTVDWQLMPSQVGIKLQPPVEQTGIDQQHRIPSGNVFVGDTVVLGDLIFNVELTLSYMDPLLPQHGSSDSDTFVQSGAISRVGKIDFGVGKEVKLYPLFPSEQVFGSPYPSSGVVVPY